MPRPDSKILSQGAFGGTAVTDVESKDANSNAEKLIAKVRLSPEEKAAAKQKLADDKAAERAVAAAKAEELKKKKADLDALLKQAHQPLNDVENAIKAHKKAGADAIAVHNKAVAAFNKSATAHDKALATLNAKRDKFEAAFEKTKAKIDAQIAKLG